MNGKSVIRRNIEWFQKSGVMRPADGFWGVGERICVVPSDETAGKICAAFPAQTPIAPGVVALEHRRCDCCIQTAFMFDLAADVLKRPALRRVTDEILDYLTRRSCLQETAETSPARGLWGFANPFARQIYWTDDNAWMVVLLLLLAKRGRPGLHACGLAGARALFRHARPYLDHVIEKGKDVPYPDPAVVLNGLQLNPHWMGLVAMACASAAKADVQTPYESLIRDYHRLVLDGPPAHDVHSSRPTSTGLPWSLSEYAYLTLTASVVAQACPLPDVIHAARHAADTLCRFQEKDGHFRSEHYETPNAPHLADLVYTQNWGTLGLYHAAQLFDSKPYRAAFRRSLTFLASIQDRSPEPHFAGCWRGLYDTAKGQWGGGDLFEGGQGSIYSGWTNAPIATAFLLQEAGQTLFA